MFQDLKNQGVLITGSIDTAFRSDKSDESKDRIAAAIPMGRFSRIEEVAPAFVFFAPHNCSGYITRTDSRRQRRTAGALSERG